MQYVYKNLPHSISSVNLNDSFFTVWNIATGHFNSRSDCRLLSIHLQIQGIVICTYYFFYVKYANLNRKIKSKMCFTITNTVKGKLVQLCSILFRRK